MTQMLIQSHRCVNDRFKSHETGTKATVYREVGEMTYCVKIFTHDGSQFDHPAFTRLETFHQGRLFYACLPRYYNRRWLSRLAGEFAGQVANQEVEHAEP